MTTATPMSWGVIVAIMIGTGLVAGLTLGLLHETIGLNPGAGVGATIGVVGAILITRRRAQQKKLQP
ncbi:MAG: hypothetical protein Q8L48_28825 [Archangium sp.]|nr:hypothetical protein [Archangium sp.]